VIIIVQRLVYTLAVFYEKGLLVKKNKNKSIEMYKKAAYLGVKEAKAWIGKR